MKWKQSLAENIIKQASFELTSSKVKFNCVIHRMLEATFVAYVFQPVAETIFFRCRKCNRNGKLQQVMFWLQLE